MLTKQSKQASKERLKLVPFEVGIAIVHVHVHVGHLFPCPSAFSVITPSIDSSTHSGRFLDQSQQSLPISQQRNSYILGQRLIVRKKHRQQSKIANRIVQQHNTRLKETKVHRSFILTATRLVTCPFIFPVQHELTKKQRLVCPICLCLRLFTHRPIESSHILSAYQCVVPCFSQLNCIIRKQEKKIPCSVGHLNSGSFPEASPKNRTRTTRKSNDWAH